MNKLKGYFWRPSKDSEYGVGIVATSVKEAKKMGWKYWGSLYGNDETWIEIECHLKKDVDVSGLDCSQVFEPEVNYFDGLKRNLYDFVDTECPICFHEERIVCKDGIVGCEDCLSKI